jgi:PAS domain S-box-containing protein
MTNRNDTQSQDLIQTDLEIQTEKLRRITENIEDLQDRYTELYDLAPVGYIFMDEHGVILESNRTFATLMETSQDSLISKTLACFILGEDQDIYHLFEKKISETGEESGCELRMKTGDSVSFWVCLKGKLYRDKKHGKLVRRIIVSDINKYRQTEEALIESEERFRIFLERLPGGVFAHDLNGRILFCNEMACKNTGYSKEELLDMSVSDIDPNSINRDDRTRFWNSLNTGQCATIESTHIRKDGSQYPAEIHISAVRLQGKPIILPIAFDITKRKRAENVAEEAHQRLLTVLDSINATVHVSDMESYDILFVNQYVRENFGDVAGKKCWSALQSGLNGPCPFCINQKLVDDSGNPKRIYRRELKNTKTGRWYDSQDRAIKWVDGRMVKLGIGIDITDRKRAEEMIKISLSEKETLLKEVHHRVKNNMQVISSLLNLQIMRNKNEQIKKALMDCQGRISSMASAHEMLYASDNLSLIDCQAYISKLTNDIVRSYQTDLHRVKLTVNAEGITLGIQQASSLGLIINELLSNALKYGFPENMHGRIMIRLRMCEQNIMEFVFSDNGVGIPQDLDWRNTKSLGLNLIVLLTKNQLRGTVSLNSREGACFTIRFKRETNQI